MPCLQQPQPKAVHAHKVQLPAHLSCSTTSSRACSTYAPHPLLPSSPLLLMGLAACWLRAGQGLGSEDGLRCREGRMLR